MSSLEKSTTNTGYIVGSKDGKLLRVDTDTHLISIARTGGGKGKTVAIPNLLDHEGSVLSLEIDGETLLATEFYRRNILKQQIRILDPFHAPKHLSVIQSISWIHSIHRHHFSPLMRRL